ncbi:MAG: BLUF domain-containing protein [Proteobacteria bacterium]|nr:BLUF domain-containing protein [Pseudomonadota bacterium]
MDIALLYRARLASPSSSFFSLRLSDLAEERVSLGVTGFLLMADGYAYELLEGEFSAVSGAFASVLAADELGDIEMLSNATITRRACQQWAHGFLDDEAEVPSDLAAKVQMLHHFANRFGSSQPVLRDFLARIGQDITSPACRLPRVSEVQYALAG